MNLSIKELKDVIEAVLKNMEEDGLKGRDGYKSECDDETKPRGFSPGGQMDFSQDATNSLGGNRYKRQGASNMGPWTNETTLRAVIKSMIIESFKMKPVPNSQLKLSAPFDTRVTVGKKGSVGNVQPPEWKTTKKEGTVWENLANWYDVPSVKESVDVKVKSQLVDLMESRQKSSVLISRTTKKRK